MSISAPTQRVVDAHCHFGSCGIRTFAERAVAPLAGHELSDLQLVSNYVAMHGLSFIVLVPMYAPSPEYAFQLNEAVVGCARALPGKIVPGLWVDPSPTMRKRLREAIALAERSNVRVLKTSADVWEGSFSADPATWDSSTRRGMSEIIDYAADGKCLLQMHTGSGRSDIKAIEKLMQWAPRGMLFQLVHMGSTVSGHLYLVPRLREWIGEGLEVFCDTSLARGFAVRWLIAEAAKDPQLEDRILFASDEPWGIFASALSAVLQATQHLPRLREAVLAGNATKLCSRLEAIA